MCPLRIILIFLSATLAGFFVLRNLKSPPDIDDEVSANDNRADSPKNSKSRPLSSQVCASIGKGFWTCVDMASGSILFLLLLPIDARFGARFLLWRGAIPWFASRFQHNMDFVVMHRIPSSLTKGLRFKPQDCCICF